MCVCVCVCGFFCQPIYQGLKRIQYKSHHIFELFPIVIGVTIVWVYATILTVAGAYDHASYLGQIHCRVDRSGMVSEAPWYVDPKTTFLLKEYFYLGKHLILHALHACVCVWAFLQI